MTLVKLLTRVRFFSSEEELPDIVYESGSIIECVVKDIGNGLNEFDLLMDGYEIEMFVLAREFTILPKGELTGALYE